MPRNRTRPRKPTTAALGLAVALPRPRRGPGVPGTRARVREPASPPSLTCLPPPFSSLGLRRRRRHRRGTLAARRPCRRPGSTSQREEEEKRREEKGRRRMGHRPDLSSRPASRVSEPSRPTRHGPKPQPEPTCQPAKPEPTFLGPDRAGLICFEPNTASAFLFSFSFNQT